jgi:signal transduction histidine kinase
MKLRTRLIIMLAAIAFIVAGPAVYAVSRLATLKEIASQQRTRHAFAFLQLGGLQTGLAELDRFERGYIIDGSQDQRIAMLAALRTARSKVNALSEVGYSQDVRAISRTLDQLEASTGHIISLMEAGRAEEATTYFEEVKPYLAAATQNLEVVGSAIDERSRAGVVNAQRISSQAAATTLAALVICLLIAIGFGIWNAARITTPILQLRQTMARVAEGDFAVPERLPINRPDEVGDLSRSFSWMTQQLRKLDQMKAEFISIATHELKTPINVISGYTELMEEGIYGNPTPKQRESLETIREQTRILTNLVNQLLDISRLEAGGLQLAIDDVVLRDFFARIERSFTVLARKKEIDFKVDVDPHVPRTIRADGDRLADQVLGNLLSNALKFTPDGGSIRVRCWMQSDGLHIEVRDSGVGVPADQLPYIFDKYFQVGQQARSKGAGLGLAIAREVVEAHGGWIVVESQPGNGATFGIVLPTHRIKGTAADRLIEKSA